MVEITPVPTSSDDDDEPAIPVVLPENLSARFQRLIGRNIDQNRVLPGPLPNPQFDTTTASLENVNMSDNARENGVEEVTMATVDRFENGDWVDIQDPAHNTRWHV